MGRLKMIESFLEHDILVALGARSDIRIWKSKPYINRDRNGKILGGLALPKGHPDLAGVLRGGTAVFIEIKTDTGVASQEQVAFGKMLRDMGACYLLVRSVEEAVRGVQEWQMTRSLIL